MQASERQVRWGFEDAEDMGLSMGWMLGVTELRSSNVNVTIRESC